MEQLFRKFAAKTSQVVGTSYSFVIAVILIVAWFVSGPFFNYSDTWQLAINTGTTIITFLMVFLIQNTQNRDARAMHLKLDELVHTMKGARNSLISVEDMSDEELLELEEEFRKMQTKYNAALERRKSKKSTTTSK